MNTNNKLELARPERVGISPKGILDFIDTIQDKKVNLHSFILLRHGKVVAEGYYKPFHKDLLHNIYSVSKSVTSAAVGIAIGEGLISLDDKVIDFFPEKLEGEVHEYTAQMTIEHLLKMATVHRGSTNKNIKDWVIGFLNTPPSHFPGTIFAYDTTGTHTLCAIIQKVTGMTVHQYLKTRVFDPIGMGEIKWATDELNINMGGSGIKCKTEDLARFGQLYLNQGMWYGKQVLPEGWAKLSTEKRIDNTNTKVMLDGNKGYGYQFWRCRNNSYCAFGMAGQLVVVIPHKDVVFVSTANTHLYRDGHQMILDSMWETIYPAIADDNIDYDDIAYSKMKDRLNNLKLILPPGENRTPNSKALSNRKYVFDQNPLGYQACEVVLGEEQSSFTFTKENEKIKLHFGMNEWITEKDPFFRVASANAGTWVDVKTLIINIQIFQEMHMFILTCRFEGDTMTIHIQPAGGMEGGPSETFLNGKEN